MMSFTYITDYIGSNITKICNLTGQITCNIMIMSNIIYYVTGYDETGSILFYIVAVDRMEAYLSAFT